MSQSQHAGWRLVGVTAIFCSAVFAIGVLDQVGMAPCGMSLCGLLGVAILALGLVVSLPYRWRYAWKSTAFAMVLCIAVPPSISIATPHALRARFTWHRREYEAVADGIRRGTHPLSLSRSERSLGHWADVERTLRRDAAESSDAEPERGPIVVVYFLVVSHGFAGGVGFARAYGEDADAYLRRGRGFGIWRRSSPLGNGWYIVAG